MMGWRMPSFWRASLRSVWRIGGSFGRERGGITGHRVGWGKRHAEAAVMSGCRDSDSHSRATGLLASSRWPVRRGGNGHARRLDWRQRSSSARLPSSGEVGTDERGGPLRGSDSHRGTGWQRRAACPRLASEAMRPPGRKGSVMKLKVIGMIAGLVWGGVALAQGSQSPSMPQEPPMPEHPCRGRRGRSHPAAARRCRTA